jgi:hypothetical protein
MTGRTRRLAAVVLLALPTLLGGGGDLDAFEYGALSFDDDSERREWRWSEVAP